MGSEPSPEPVDAQEATRAAFLAAFEKKKAEEKAKWEKQHAGKAFNKDKYLAQKRGAATADSQSSLGEGEILSQEQPETMPIRSAGSSQQTPASSLDGSDPLASWKPRKEPMTKPSKSNALPADDFIGFGNVSASQEGDQPVKRSSKIDAETKTITQNGKPPLAKESTSIPTKSPNAQSTKTKSKQSRDPSSKVNTPADFARRSNIATQATKRPATTNPFADERRPTLSNMPKIPKRTSVASPQSPDRVEEEPEMLSHDERPPKWYKDTKRPDTRDKNDSESSTMLQSLRTLIQNCKKPEFGHDSKLRSKTFMEIRNKLHNIIFLEVKAPLLKYNRMLDNESGLPQIFDSAYNGGVEWPYDIKADAEELYNKWAKKDFQADILRGIVTSTVVKDGKKSTSDSIDPKYKNISFRYFGNGDLLNGQWWPYQICTIRDGAHGSSQGGISGKAGEGAYSCVMAGGVAQDGKPYPDVDNGNLVVYCGTDNDIKNYDKDEETGKPLPSPSTRYLLENHKNGRPVRFIRSHKLQTKYAPKEGFRYDGLYDVDSYERLDGEWEPRQRHRFTLRRQPGQDPIRGGDGPEARPTAQEMEKLYENKRFKGGGRD